MAIKKRPTTDLPPDPEPAATPGLSKGGGTQPGDTPPASGQETQPSNPVNRPGFRSVLEARMEHDEPEVLSRDARARAADAR
ncbi:DUF6480 family protein [Mycobacteroides abscessus]|uniref:DUF6480 family protein n=1 Tax=Mycobacteroides abscessus TaxID=36809 RepID=UPI0021067ECA